MQLIDLRYPFDQNLIPNEPVVLAMGFFDGVHKGHQQVLAQARKLADEKGVKMAVLTYDHHPTIVFKNVPTQFQYLTTWKRKQEVFEEMGTDILYRISFTSKLAKLTPQEFTDKFMVGLHALAVVAGFDHTYGPKDVATMANLPKYAAGRFEVHSIPAFELDGEKVGSTRIRAAIDGGLVDVANDLLGYVYKTTGLVVHGHAIGRTIGYPTANILTTNGERIPGVGVYAVRIKIGADWYDAMASVGYNETFGDNRPKTVEIFIFDFSEEIYGENVEVQWHHLLRGMVKFNGVEALIDQLKADDWDSREYFKQLEQK